MKLSREQRQRKRKKRYEPKPPPQDPSRVKHRPAEVLRYIDLIWMQAEPRDVVSFARELGYDPKVIVGLQKKHGDKLIGYLERVQRSRDEQLEYMASQHGQANPHQYVTSPHGAIDDLPVVPKEYRDRYADEGRERDRERLEGVVAAALEVRAIIKERMDKPEFREMTQLTIRRMDRDIEKLIQRTKRKAA